MDTNGHEWTRMDHENWEYLNHEWTRMDTNGHKVWEYLNHETHETHEKMIGWEKPSLS